VRSARRSFADLCYRGMKDPFIGKVIAYKHGYRFPLRHSNSHRKEAKTAKDFFVQSNWRAFVGIELYAIIEVALTY